MEDSINFSEHQEMLKTLTKLPQYPILGVLTPDRSIELENQKNFWQWTAGQIDYLQQIDWGLCPSDPLDDPRLHTLQRWQINTHSNYRFAQLKLIIAGWDLIKNKAAENHRCFSFNNPREVFTEFCRQQAEVDISDVFSDEGKDGGIGAVRDNYRSRAAFYRDRLNKEETKELLEIHRNSKYWENFIIYAIWEKRYSGMARGSFRMKECWKAFLAAHKDLTTFFCNKKAIDGCRLTLPKWCYGIAINPKTGQQLRPKS